MVGLCASMWACGPQHLEPSPWARFDLAYLASSGAGAPRYVTLSDAAGTDRLTLATRAVHSDGIAWAPDGDQIAYLTEIEVNGDGVVLRWGLGGVGVEEDTQLAELVRESYRPPPTPNALVLSWSPSGEHVAVTLPGGSTAFQCNMAGMELWLVKLQHVDATASRRIATDVDTVAATWNANGRALAYAEHYLVCGDEGELASFGWNARALSVDPDVGLGTVADVWDFDEWGPVWSPHGDAVAFAAGSRTALQSRIDIVDEPGGPARVLTEVAECGLEVGAWFPDGERLLVRRTCAAGSAHLIIDAARGTVEAELPDLGPAVTMAPDGERVAYVIARDEEPQVAVFDLIEGRSLTIGAGVGPAWRPD